MQDAEAVGRRHIGNLLFDGGQPGGIAVLDHLGAGLRQALQHRHLIEDAQHRLFEFGGAGVRPVQHRGALGPFGLSQRGQRAGQQQQGQQAPAAIGDHGRPLEPVFAGALQAAAWSPHEGRLAKPRFVRAIGVALTLFTRG